MTTPMGALAPEFRVATRAIVSAAGRADRSFVVGAVSAGAASATSRVPALGNSVGDSAEDNCAVLVLGRSDACAAGSGASADRETTAGRATDGDNCVGVALVSAGASLEYLVLAASQSSRRSCASDGGSISVNGFAGVSVSGATDADANATGSRTVPFSSRGCSSDTRSRAGATSGIAASVELFWAPGRFDGAIARAARTGRGFADSTVCGCRATCVGGAGSGSGSVVKTSKAGSAGSRLPMLRSRPSARPCSAIETSQAPERRRLRLARCSRREPGDGDLERRFEAPGMGPATISCRFATGSQARPARELRRGEPAPRGRSLIRCRLGSTRSVACLLVRLPRPER
jgi:hypothetical protein